VGAPVPSAGAGSSADAVVSKVKSINVVLMRARS
jgi:hypothetical protein